MKPMYDKIVADDGSKREVVDALADLKYAEPPQGTTNINFSSTIFIMDGKSAIINP